jgi:LPXTG-motif cell wall-anchored protein
MEFLILLGICVLIVVGVAWFGRRRRDVSDPTLAARASSDVEADRIRSIRPTRFRDGSGRD